MQKSTINLTLTPTI